MYDNVIWIDGGYWLAAWLIISIALMLPTFFNSKIGPADSLALSFGACFAALIVMIAGLWFLSLIGVNLGMRG